MRRTKEARTARRMSLPCGGGVVLGVNKMRKAANLSKEGSAGKLWWEKEEKNAPRRDASEAAENQAHEEDGGGCRGEVVQSWYATNGEGDDQSRLQRIRVSFEVRKGRGRKTHA
jgi:hypothetical protein